MGQHSDVDTGESEWVHWQDWKGVNDWGRTDELGNPVEDSSSMASSNEAPAAAGPLGPFPPLPAGTRPEDVEIGRGMRRMLLALAQSQGAAGCGTEPMDELVASEGMETAQQQDKGHFANEGEAEQTRIAREKEAQDREMAHYEALMREITGETVEETFKSDSSDEVLFWGFDGPYQPESWAGTSSERLLEEHADKYVRLTNRASHYIPWLYERNPEELRAWSPARMMEQMRRLREEAMRKGSPHVSRLLFERARLAKRMHLLAAGGHGFTQPIDFGALPDRLRRKAIAKAWETPPYLLFTTELGNFTMQLLWALNPRACRVLSHAARHRLLDGSKMPLRLVPGRFMIGGAPCAVAGAPAPNQLPDGSVGARRLAGNYSHFLGGVDRVAGSDWSESDSDTVRRMLSGKLQGRQAGGGVGAEEVVGDRGIEAGEGVGSCGWQHVAPKAEAGVVYVSVLEAEAPGAGDTLSAPDAAPSFLIATGEDPLIFRTHVMVGVVSEGMDVIQQLALLAVDRDNSPLTPNHVTSVRASLLSSADLEHLPT